MGGILRTKLQALGFFYSYRCGPKPCGLGILLSHHPLFCFFPSSSCSCPQCCFVSSFILEEKTTHIMSSCNKLFLNHPPLNLDSAALGCKYLFIWTMWLTLTAEERLFIQSGAGLLGPRGWRSSSPGCCFLWLLLHQVAGVSAVVTVLMLYKCYELSSRIFGDGIIY